MKQKRRSFLKQGLSAALSFPLVSGLIMAPGKLLADNTTCGPDDTTDTDTTEVDTTLETTIPGDTLWYHHKTRTATGDVKSMKQAAYDDAIAKWNLSSMPSAWSADQNMGQATEDVHPWEPTDEAPYTATTNLNGIHEPSSFATAVAEEVKNSSGIVIGYKYTFTKIVGETKVEAATP